MLLPINIHLNKSTDRADTGWCAAVAYAGLFGSFDEWTSAITGSTYADSQNVLPGVSIFDSYGFVKVLKGLFIGLV